MHRAQAMTDVVFLHSRCARADDAALGGTGWKEHTMAVSIDKGACLSCGVCVGECPQDALSLGAESVEVDEGSCIECGICVGECPVGALSL